MAEWSLPPSPLPISSLLSFTQNRSHSNSPTTIPDFSRTATTISYSPTELNTENMNKIFASKFLDKDTKVVVGSKNGRLEVFDFKSGKRFEITSISKNGLSAQTTSPGRKSTDSESEPLLSQFSGQASSRRNIPVRPFQAYVPSSPLSQSSDTALSASINRIDLEEHTTSAFSRYRKTRPSLSGKQMMRDAMSSHHDRVISSSPLAFFQHTQTEYDSYTRSTTPIAFQTPNRGTSLDQSAVATAPAIPMKITSGIYDIATNPGKTFLAANDVTSQAAVIYDMPSFTPLLMLDFHQDAIFSMSFVNNNTLVTGSRDSSIAIWDLEAAPTGQKVPYLKHSLAHQQSVDVINPIHSFHTISRVRVVREDRRTGNMATLQVAGQVVLYDSNSLQMSRCIQLPNVREPVAMALNDNHGLYSVGDLTHLSLIDPRASQSIVRSIESLDNGWGVRSIAFNSHIMAIGGALGKISFYDLRNQRYVTLPDADDNFSSLGRSMLRPNANEPKKQELESGFGWLHRDDNYKQGFADKEIRHAVYTMDYDQSGQKLFTGGGPLQLGLTGSYAAVWS